MGWARLRKRVFDIDLEARRRIDAFVTAIDKGVVVT